MDTWILVGFILVILVILAPILAMVALSRTGRMQYQITELNQKVYSLETQIAQFKQSQSISSETPIEAQSHQEITQHTTELVDDGIEQPIPRNLVPSTQSEQDTAAESVIAYQQVEPADNIEPVKETPVTVLPPLTNSNATELNLNRFDSYSSSKVNPNRFNSAKENHSKKYPRLGHRKSKYTS